MQLKCSAKQHRCSCYVLVPLKGQLGAMRVMLTWPIWRVINTSALCGIPEERPSSPFCTAAATSTPLQYTHAWVLWRILPFSWVTKKFLVLVSGIQSLLTLFICFTYTCDDKSVIIHLQWELWRVCFYQSIVWMPERGPSSDSTSVWRLSQPLSADSISLRHC